MELCPSFSGHLQNITKFDASKLIHIICKEVNHERTTEVNCLLDSHGEERNVMFAIYVTFLESAKLNLEPSVYKSSLTNIAVIPDDLVILLTDTYEQLKSKIRKLLMQLGPRKAHVTNTDWRLDYNIKNTYLNRVNEPSLVIQLEVETIPGKTQNLNFQCSQEELQLMVTKVKEACKCAEQNS